MRAMRRGQAAFAVVTLVAAAVLAGGAAGAGTKFHKAVLGDATVNAPLDVSADAAGQTWIADVASGRLLIQDIEGATTGIGTVPITAATRAGIAPTTAGDIGYYVQALESGVRRFGPHGETLTPVPGVVALNGPVDDALGDPTGSLYIANSGTNTVVVLDPVTGALRNTITGADSTSGAFSSVGGVAVNAAGTIYITDTDQNRIAVYSSTTGTSATFVREFIAGQAGLGSLAIDGFGNLLVVQSNFHRVLDYAPSTINGGAPLSQIGTGGSGNGQFNLPVGVGVNPDGLIFVTDPGNQRVQRFNANGTFDRVITGGRTTGQPEWQDPEGVGSDASGNVYVADQNLGVVEKLGLGGAFLQRFQDAAVTTPLDVVVNDDTNDVYVAAGNKVARFNALGVLQNTDTGPADSYIGASKLAFDQANNVLYVTDFIKGNVVADVPSLGAANVVASGGSAQGQFLNPDGIGVEPSGNIVVADNGHDRVQELTSTGTFVREWGTSGTQPGQFQSPSGVAVEPNGTVDVSDLTNNNITRFSMPASPATTPVPIDTVGTGVGTTELGTLQQPQDVSVDGFGTGWVADTGLKRVQRYGITGGLNPISPTRILDTRDNTGITGAFGPHDTKTLDVTETGGSGVPDTGVDAVVLNITSVSPTAGGWLTIYPAGAALPVATSLNFAAGQTVANLVVVKVGHGGANEGKIAITNTDVPTPPHPPAGFVNVVGDIVGWYADGSSAGVNISASEFVGVTPVRVADTRFGMSAGCPTCQGAAAPVAASGTISLDFATWPSLPAVCQSSEAVVLNVVATSVSAPGWLTIYPNDESVPLAANLNFSPGENVANLVTVKVGGDNKVAIANTRVPGSSQPPSAPMHVVADMVGCYKTATPVGAPTYLTSIAPARILDTRSGLGVTGGSTAPLGPHASITVDPQTAVGVLPPAGGYAGVIVHVTTIVPTLGGWLTIYPSGATLPTAASLNFAGGQVVANLAKVAVGPDGKFTITNTDVPTAPHPTSGTVHVAVDIVGYYN